MRERQIFTPRVCPGAVAFSLETSSRRKHAARRPLVPCLTLDSLVLAAAAARDGLATGFWFWASPATPASADLALEADTAARTAAAPGALCFLFLPPMLLLRQNIPPGLGAGFPQQGLQELLTFPGSASPPCVLHPGFSGLGDHCLAIGRILQGPASSPQVPATCGAPLWSKSRLLISGRKSR